MIKKAFKIVGISLLILLIAAVAIPYFFKDQIVEAIKEDINKSINAKVDFADVNLSLFKSFPDFNFELEELSVTGINEFEGYSLVKADNIELSLDLMSVISSDRPIEINTVQLDQPQINIKVLRNGKANYDIVKPSDAPEAAASELNFLVQLESYAINNGQFIYDDRQGGTYLALKDLDHNGQGAFTQDIFDLITKTAVGSITAKSGGIAYLNKAKADIDLTLSADIPNSKYTIKDNTVRLNALKLNTEGFVQLLENKVNIDFKYDAPQNNFKNFLSMIPSAYTADYEDVEANGALQFNGFVKGNYNLVTGALPAFQVNLKVDEANFKYPDLPLGISSINTTTKITSPSSNFDKMVIDVSNFKMELGNNPFEASIKLWTLMSDPNIDSKIKGTIDLEELSNAFPIEGVKKFNGIITSNLVAKTSMSAIDNKDFDNINMIGDVRMENLFFSSDFYPEVKVKDMQMNFTPTFVKLDKFDGQLGKSDLQAQGTLDNVLAYFTPDRTMTGKLNVRSQFFDSNEWMSTEEVAAEPSVAENTSEEYEVFDRFDFTIDGEIKKLYYDVYELRDATLKGQITPNRANFSEFSTKIGESDFKMNGNITNIFNYLYENETMKGDINMVSNYINANEFMVEPSSGEVEAKTINETAAAEMEVILVPEKMDFDINADIKKVLYTNIELKNIKGLVKVANESVTLKDCDANTLGGSVTMNGTYDTKNPEKPKFDMDYKVNSLQFQNAFKTLNTFASLAPIGKFIEGKFNTTLKMSGELGKDMMPNLGSLSASGFLETIDGTLKNFKPVEEFANKLNLSFLKAVDLKNTKNWFDVKDGKVTIKDFNYSVKDIDMIVGGSHGLDDDMRYNIKAKVPRALLEKSKAVGKGLDFLKGQASKFGINIDQGSHINVAAVVSGSMLSPKVDLKLLNAEGEAVGKDDLIDAGKEAVLNKGADIIEEKTGVDIRDYKAELEAAKNKLILERDTKIDSTMKVADERVDQLVQKAEQEAQKGKDAAKKKADQAKAEAYKAADLLVEKAGNNPFKKKAAEITAKKAKEKADSVYNKALEESNAGFDKAVAGSTKQGEEIKQKARDQAKSITSDYDKKIKDLETKMSKEEAGN